VFSTIWYATMENKQGFKNKNKKEHGPWNAFDFKLLERTEVVSSVVS
jgi:hypothetical protein